VHYTTKINAVYDIKIEICATNLRYVIKTTDQENKHINASVIKAK